VNYPLFARNANASQTTLPAFLHAGKTHRARWRLPRRWAPRGEGDGARVDVVACGGGMGRTLAFATEGRVEEEEEEARAS
jgi:hypothetical protein